MGLVEIEQVGTRTQMREFIELSWRIYRSYENWVPPLKSEIRRLLDTGKHPFWKFGERELFLARRRGEVVGRIAAIIDPNYNHYHNEKVGVWGFFECENDENTAAALFSAAKDWVSAKGMNFFRGPMSPSTNYEIGMLVEGFQYPPVIMMPYNPPYYLDLAQACGLEKEKDLIALKTRRDHMRSDRVERLARRIVRTQKVSIRPFDRKHFGADVRLLKEIYEDSWSDNWGFVPLSPDEVDELAKNLKKIADPDLVFFLYYRDEPAGVCMVLWDINPVLKKLNGTLGITGLIKIMFYKKLIRNVRGVLFGFKKQYRKLGLPLVAFDYLMRIQAEKKFVDVELGWNLEDNDAINQFDTEIGGKVYKRYRIFGNPIA